MRVTALIYTATRNPPVDMSYTSHQKRPPYLDFGILARLANFNYDGMFNSQHTRQTTAYAAQDASVSAAVAARPLPTSSCARSCGCNGQGVDEQCDEWINHTERNLVGQSHSNENENLNNIDNARYLLSNSTTDVAKMDSLTNPEVCRRDAALMSKLGINTIYVDALDPTANHDDCFSIFNSVGIYVAVAFNTRLFIDGSAIENTYTTQRLHDMFEWVDAVKDYENLLAFDVGTFPNMEAIGFDWTHYAEAQKIFRVSLCLILATILLMRLSRL